ncbi:VWA domain-containing protein [Thalassotalea sp. LPB0316]|uniref:vWA domain-containing protein n=1 Tax=Thalassotalea sp. LPB0316 TaxID=2769490 RepID=UPI001868C300|nr:VWA domain-containing protein [Thalassotalea sp. LPB0316]QOL25092.1 VWA domain-containing protein [Thalassotalea sp. LPB0316]
MFEVVYPWLLLLLPLPWFVRFIPEYKQQTHMVTVPFFKYLIDVSGEKPQSGAEVVKPNKLQRFVLLTTWCLLVLAAAKPQLLGEPIEQTKTGRDLMVAVDASGSMSAQDFEISPGENVDRLTVVKSVLQELATQREKDRLGLIIFGSAAYLQMPFSEDHKTWLTLLNELQIAMAGPSTVIGDAVGLAIKHFEESDTDNRVLIILTDGNDSGSKVPPVDAAKIAQTYGVKIYTIAIGDPRTVGEQKLDTETLERMAEITGGGYFQALDTQELANAYQAIADIEQQEFSSISFRPKSSLHHVLIGIALMLNLLMIFYLSMTNKSKVAG